MAAIVPLSAQTINKDSLKAIQRSLQGFHAQYNIPDTTQKSKLVIAPIAPPQTPQNSQPATPAGSSTPATQGAGKAENFGNKFMDQFLDRRPHRKHRDTTAVSEPVAFGDFTWLQGSDRRHSALLQTKYFTGTVLFDINYTASGTHPNDNTVVGSTSLARNNEVTLNTAAFGGDFNYNNVRGRLIVQLGTRTTVVPRNDGSVYRGQYDLATAYRYFSEAYGGYHFNAMHGINLDAGIFMSYVGLFSYYNAENWSYQPSFTSDNTPWFFNGVRLQIFPSDKFKQEIWLINGWQSYGKFNSMPGVGLQDTWSPVEWFRLVSNNYLGTDVQDNPHVYRIHSDNSLLIRYLNHPSGRVTRMAFSLTQDLGFQKGPGFGGFGLLSSQPQSSFLSGMIYNRTWFWKDHFGWTIGGGYIHNPGRYLVLLPSGQAGQIALPTGPTQALTPPVDPFSSNPGDHFDGWDLSNTLDWMPNEMITFRVEFVHRATSVPYFAGRGGVTSPDGYTTTALPVGWMPDLVKTENRFIAALLVRF
jgi:hypothetical protein